MQSTASNKVMRTRMRVLLFCFLIFGFAVIIGRLFLIQIAHGEMYQQLAVEQQTRSTILGAQRGTIYDRNGNVLAMSSTVWNVCISPAQIDEKQLDSIADNLAEILDIDRQKVLDEAEKKRSYYQRIKMRVDRETADRVLAYTTENNIEGVFFEEDTKRYYRYGSMASTVLGFVNYDNHGAYGLEAYYDSVLSGQSGVVVSAKNAWGSDMPFKHTQRYEAQDGSSVVLTIDEAIQHFLERNLETAVVEHAIGNRAAGVVMNINTGEILAMATKPDFDPNDPYVLKDPNSIATLEALIPDSEEYNATLKQLQYDQWRNKAISDTYEPGSVFKIVTAATALDNNKVSLNDHFTCYGSLQVASETIRCWKHGGHGDQNFVQGMQNSCNPVFMTVGQRVGARLLYDYIQNFGLMEPSGIDLPGEAVGIMHSFDTLNKEGMVELSSTSFGQSLKVTPLQMINATSAAVNGGNLMQPFIVKQVLDSDGNVLETIQPVVKRQVISETTSETMQYLVEQVVKEGSGSKAAIPGYRIGGKTGTSQKLDINPDSHILSFVGFAPMEDPQYAILVMLDEPAESAYGSVIAAPVVGAIFQEMLAYLNVDPQLTAEQLAETEVETPNLIGMKPHDAQAELTALGLKTRMVGSGTDVVRQIPQAFQKMPKGGTVILYTEEEVLNSELSIPDVVGLDAQEANQVIVEMGLNIELRGSVRDGVPAVVQEQWPFAGTEAKTGDVVYITLVERTTDEAAAADLQLEMEASVPALSVDSGED